VHVLSHALQVEFCVRSGGLVPSQSFSRCSCVFALPAPSPVTGDSAPGGL
jgi:hypothetical protein